MEENNAELGEDEISSFKKILLSKKANSILPITVFDFVIGVIAFFCLFSFSFLVLYDINTNSIQTIILTFIECGFAFIGIFFLTINCYKINKQDKLVKFFQKDSILTIFGFGIIFVSSILISILTGNYEILFTISIIDLVVVFGAIGEEMFFRGFLITYFKDLYLTFRINEKGKWLKYIYIVLIIASTSFLFTIIHVNSYQNIPFLIELFIVGIFYGTYYWVTKDLTACILAHLLRNILWVRELVIFIPGIIIIALYFFYIFILEKRSSTY